MGRGKPLLRVWWAQSAAEQGPKLPHTPAQSPGKEVSGRVSQPPGGAAGAAADPQGHMWKQQPRVASWMDLTCHVPDVETVAGVPRARSRHRHPADAT